ncbi:MAG TPA: phosphoenolpyruvate-utilizing N-terminal domain-containing protein, partial [Steroidobacteraceae bacterium]
MNVWLSGIGVSRGVAIGRVQRMHGGDLEVPEYLLGQDEVEPEVERFSAAQRLARDQLRQVRSQIPRGLPGEIAAFIDTHLLMLDDRSMTDAVVALIRQHRCNAEIALRRQRDALIAVFEQMEDPYLRTRKDDVVHVADRILRILLKHDKVVPKADASTEPQVVVADDLTPADIILMAQQQVVAFISEYGGPLS